MQMEAISAIETSTSALMSKAVTRPIIASSTMGIPHKTTAIQAGLKGREKGSKILASNARAEITRKAISFFIPPKPRIYSVFSAIESTILIDKGTPFYGLKIQDEFEFFEGTGCYSVYP